MMSFGTQQIPIFAFKTSPSTTMALVYICMMQLLSMSVSFPSGNVTRGNYEQVLLVFLMTCLSLTRTIFSVMTSHYTNIDDGLVCLHVITAWTYLLLQEFLKCLVDYQKTFKYGRTRTPPGSCIILHHPCFATSTDSRTHVASDRLSVCLSCCSVCKPSAAAKNPPEVVYIIVSKEAVPGPDVATVYFIDMLTT